MMISSMNLMILALIQLLMNLKNIWTHQLSLLKVLNCLHGGMQLETQTLLLIWQLTSCLLPVSQLSHSISFFTDLYLASSCDVKQGFSWGGLVISKLQHRLSDESTCASTVLHAWSEIPGLIPESEIIQMFKDKYLWVPAGTCWLQMICHTTGTWPVEAGHLWEHTCTALDQDFWNWNTCRLDPDQPAG